MCRALQIVCVAGGKPSLATLKRATVAEEWELTPGATDAEEALAQIESRKAHVLVTWGAFADLVKQARERFPGLRIVVVGRSWSDGVVELRNRFTGETDAVAVDTAATVIVEKIG